MSGSITCQEDPCNGSEDTSERVLRNPSKMSIIINRSQPSSTPFLLHAFEVPSFDVAGTSLQLKWK